MDGNKSVGRNLLGLLLLVTSFWFKQHGAVLAIGGLLFLCVRSGWKISLVYALFVIIAGPLAYLFAGQQLFGTHFHYFTWSVPSQWSGVTWKTFVRYFGLVGISYAVLAISACWSWLQQARHGFKSLDVWRFQLPFAMLAGFMGALDWGSSNNVFIAQGVWFVIVGTIGLREISRLYPRFDLDGGTTLLIASAFALLLYEPQSVIVSPAADAKYDELVEELKSLPGRVYAPSVGQLQRGYEFSPSAHWVALEDMVRTPGKEVRNHAGTRALLAPLLNAETPHYILANTSSFMGFMAFLDDYYVLEKDYGDRFKALRALPKRWDHGWPRYLYRQRERGRL